ncbi:MAG: hypothetical protein R2791_17065 [Saprospiraceae bacterium]|nr:hypothetical protein [Saprospiraceae bacterium]
MKKALLLLPVLLSLFTCLIISCKPCCDDPMIVRIPEADGTPPALQWEVAVKSQTPDGPISSINLYNEQTTGITVKTTDQVDVYLIATDKESGVKSLMIQGGFGYTCTPQGGGIPLAVDGIVAKKSEAFSQLTTCGLKTWKIGYDALNVAFSCPGGGDLSAAIVTLQGNANNFKGGSSDIILNIEVTQ